MRISKSVAALVAAALCLGTPAGSYNISLKGRQHERLTVWADKCLKVSDAYPAKCAIPTAERPLHSVHYRDGKYWREARWPDDPTRQTTLFGIVKFAGNVGFDKCLDYLADPTRYAGLLCNSHYGSLQFLHAMTTSVVPQPGQSELDLTTAQIVSWTELAFSVANGSIKANAPFCRTVRQYGAAGEALAPPDFPFCATWTMASLFGMTCRNPLDSRTCSQNNDPELTRRVALGALLHMVQDSYSRSHAGRAEELPNGPYPEAAVRCQPVKAFYRYSLAQKANHKYADVEPTFDASCVSQDAMDPITASARLIWLADHKCNVRWASALVRDGVLSNRPTEIVTLSSCSHPA